MRKSVSLALAGALAAATITAGTVTAEAHKGHHHGGNNVGAAIIFGLAAGALAGSLYAPRPYYEPYPYYAPYPPPYGYYPASVHSHHSSWCASQYRSYNHGTNTWVDFHGRIRVCYSPY